MKEATASLIRFGNGLRLVHLHQRSGSAGIFGIVVRAGSADEDSSSYGLAHLVEHTIFKGTEKRRSWHIINRMEAVGGELNAFTTKEETTVYSIFPAGNAPRAVELIADLAINSRFPERELEKERDVVLDEIYSYRDTPSEAVFDDFEDMVFAGSPLGHNILGTPSSVKNLGSGSCRGFLDKFYTASNMVAFYIGPQSASHIAALVERHFATLAVGTPNAPAVPSVFKRNSHEKNIRGLHQVHAVVGIPAASLYDDGRFADALFANLIGGPGMNSLLNVELRERRGLVYTVEAGVTHFSTGGLLTVYFGCDPDDKVRCMHLCSETLMSLADMPAATLERRLARAKRQYLGQMAIASENKENRVMAFARSVLYNDSLPSDEALRAAVEAVSCEQTARLAAALADPSALIYQPKI